ncbi:hypothetical protein GC101_32665 [Paenibacillus sp. LMG 31459]|uniref:Uncharacterized protein n=1 Tax=Paenibacillus phytohabitans TaxID=2654978 RepID=A0ABX1YVH5_9BACL|nr:hypothetical protein [Paenibacillus sp. FSL H8-0259]NOU83614.1 hypothetical protein [Paenibacillus phytohabitans]
MPGQPVQISLSGIRIKQKRKNPVAGALPFHWPARLQSKFGFWGSSDPPDIQTALHLRSITL